ncbi:MAG: PEGA domain-containing protein, partial [Methanoregulaceae archaeon]|nr:PEGA domain-containing protein [Methanoregulaceae archaeon]
STPMGAQVWVDTKLKGYTPMNVWLKPGRHYVTFKMDGYDEVQVIVTVNDDSMRIIRIGNDGSSEVLNTTYLYSDPVRNLDYYQAYSPNGTSTFVFTSLFKTGGPFPLFAALFKNVFPPPGSSGSSPPASNSPTAAPTSTGGGGTGGGGLGNIGGATTTPPPTVPVPTSPPPEQPPIVTAEQPGQSPPSQIPTPGVPPVTPASLPPTTAAPAPEFPGLIRNIALVAVMVIFVSVLAFRWTRRGEQ